MQDGWQRSCKSVLHKDDGLVAIHKALEEKRK